jgi:hypothetical protein
MQIIKAIVMSENIRLEIAVTLGRGKTKTHLRTTGRMCRQELNAGCVQDFQK